jgi:hypothetical protein
MPPVYESPIDVPAHALTIASFIGLGMVSCGAADAAGRTRAALARWYVFAPVLLLLVASLVGHVVMLYLFMTDYAPPPGARRATSFIEDAPVTLTTAMGAAAAAGSIWLLPRASRVPPS